MWVNGIELVRLPGGRATVGLRDSDLEAIDAICPGWSAHFADEPRAHEVTLEPFRVTRHPLSNEELRGLGFASPMGGRDDDVARVGFEEATRIARSLGGRLPTAIEWEYLCRADDTNLLPFGVSRVRDDEAVEPWMGWRVKGEQAENAFGLRVLYTGEWCDASGSEPVQCGGGAFFWPWQDDEWVWCMPTARIRERDLPEKEGSVRVVIDDDVIIDDVIIDDVIIDDVIIDHEAGAREAR